MPTVNFLGTNPAIVFSPSPSLNSQSSGGRNYYLMAGGQSAVDTIVTGTSCTISTFVNNGGGWTMTLDGVTSSLTIPTYGSWITVTLFTGLSDTPHRLTLVANGNNEYVETTTNSGILQVTGANPSLTLPDGYSANQWAITDASVSPHIGTEGLNQSSALNYQVMTAGYSGAAFRFRASGGTVKVWMFCNSQTIYVSTDNGRLVGPTILPNTNSFQWVTIATPSDTQVHEYMVYMGYKGDSGFFAYAIMTVGGSGLDLTWTPTPKKTIALYGDSITEGIRDSVSIGVYGYLFDEYQGLTIKTANRAQSGSTVVSRGVNSTAEITGIIPTPEWCIIEYGTNDLGAGTTAATFQSSYYTMMNLLTTGLPNTKFLVLSLIPRQGMDVTAYNSAIQASIGSTGNGSGNQLSTDQKAQITYIDTETWGLAGADGTDFTTNYIDGTHPNGTGNLIMYQKLLPYLGFVDMTITPHFQVTGYNNTVSITATLTGGIGDLSATTTAGTLSTSTPTSGVPFTLTTPSGSDGTAVVTVTGPASIQQSVKVKYSATTDARSVLATAIQFKVTLTPQLLLTTIQADQMTNFLYQESLRTTYIPGIGMVKNGDVFTLWGSEAVTVRDTYATGPSAVLAVIG